MSVYRSWHRRAKFVVNYMLVSKGFHDEIKPLFWLNNFHLDLGSKLLSVPGFADNIQEVTYLWRGSVKDIGPLNKLAAFRKLKSLHLQLAYGCHMPIHKSHKGNKLYQDEMSIKVFSGQNGFDNLVQIRGLQEVKVSSYHRAPKAAKDLEVFLNRVLTQPKV